MRNFDGLGQRIRFCEDVIVTIDKRLARERDVRVVDSLNRARVEMAAIRKAMKRAKAIFMAVSREGYLQ
jgi:hypothetical protein